MSAVAAGDRISEYVLERKLGERTSLTLSGRRSYIDAVLNPVLNRTSDVGVRAPRYYDFQARLMHETQNGTRVDGLFLLSDDRFLVVGEGETERRSPRSAWSRPSRRCGSRWRSPSPTAGASRAP